MSHYDKHALVFAHYHRSGLLRSDTVVLLKFLGLFFFDKVIVVSTNLNETEKAKNQRHL